MTKYIKCRFSGNVNDYTYAVLPSQLKDATIGDYVVVPAGASYEPKIVVYLGEDPNPNPNIQYKWVIQFVNNALIKRALVTPLASPNFS